MRGHLKDLITDLLVCLGTSDTSVFWNEMQQDVTTYISCVIQCVTVPVDLGT